MDVMSWNMGYWKPSHYRTIENRRRQWALVAALSPDVALLQECRPEDLAALAPGWLADMYDVVGAIPDRWTACSAILARKELGAAPIDPARLPEENRRSDAYELDRIFTDPVLHDGLVACRVHDDELVRGLSDHAPLIASFTL